MGVGPARFGLRPGLGRKPGHNPLYDNTPPRRTIHFPGTSADRFPGRSLVIFSPVRRAVYPTATLFPGAALYSGGARARSIVTMIAGAGRLVERHTVGRVRRQTLEGSGRLSNNPLSSSALPTTMSQVVELSSNRETVDLAVSGESVEVSSDQTIVVEL